MSFKDFEPKTKQMIIGAIVVMTLIIAAAITNNLDILLGIVGGIVK